MQSCLALILKKKKKEKKTCADRSGLEVVAFAQALTNTMPWRGIRHKGSPTGCCRGCKVTKTSPSVACSHTASHIKGPSPQIGHGGKQQSYFFQSFTKLKERGGGGEEGEKKGLSEHVIQSSVPPSTHGVHHRWQNRRGESVDCRAVSGSTVNSFRQNIKVLQQLLRAKRLKSEQRQAHRELLPLPGK